MHHVTHAALVRGAQADLGRRQGDRERQRSLPPDAPPGRSRAALAHLLGAAAVRVDRDVARRAVA